MSGNSFTIVWIMLNTACGLARAQEPGGRPTGAHEFKTSIDSKIAVVGRDAPTMARYKVVFWFNGTSWTSRAYDLRRGEYTKAVDDWVRRIDLDAQGFVRPGSMATVREISLPEAPAESLAQRLAAVIREELDRTLRGQAGNAIERRPDRTNREAIDRLKGRIGPVVSRARPSVDRTAGPNTGRVPTGVLPPSPFPYPHPRPHP